MLTVEEIIRLNRSLYASTCDKKSIIFNKSNSPNIEEVYIGSLQELNILFSHMKCGHLNINDLDEYLIISRINTVSSKMIAYLDISNIKRNIRDKKLSLLI